MVFLSLYTHSLGDLVLSHGFKIIHMLPTPKFISPTLISPEPRPRLSNYPADCSTWSQKGISNSTCPQLHSRSSLRLHTCSFISCPHLGLWQLHSSTPKSLGSPSTLLFSHTPHPVHQQHCAGSSLSLWPESNHFLAHLTAAWCLDYRKSLHTLVGIPAFPLSPRHPIFNQQPK